MSTIKSFLTSPFANIQYLVIALVAAKYHQPYVVAPMLVAFAVTGWNLELLFGMRSKSVESKNPDGTSSKTTEVSRFWVKYVRKEDAAKMRAQQ